MKDFNDYYSAREILEDFLRKDLLGPVRDNEIISDTRPCDYYIVGRLFPQGMLINQEEMEKTQLEDDSDNDERYINMCYSLYPSSIAVSFTIKKGIKALLAKTSFSWYEPVEREKKSGKRVDYNWHRKTKKTPVVIDTEENIQCENLHDGLELRVYLQKTFGDGSKTFTVAMINTCRFSGEMVTDNKNTFFQPEIIVSGEKEGQNVFIEKKMRVNLNQDLEVLTLEMLYHHNKNFATGHGCSVGWEAEGESASKVYTEFICTYDLLQMKPALHVHSDRLSFKFLGYEKVSVIRDALNEMANSYLQWIELASRQIPFLLEKYREVATTNIGRCREAYGRIKEGIKLLVNDGIVFQSFQLVNRAMLRLRIQHDGNKNAHTYRWYPFQLAFILQEISSIACSDNNYRDVVDLLWFPTGGGKTEAYLGLSAFTIFIRRIRAVGEKRSGAGVTVIMRYTLRLLTLQQFERASALICACEVLRRENPELLGTEEISAGLWVGKRLTPNQRDKAAGSLAIITKNGFDSLGEDDSNPCQILTCPWCRSKIRPGHYSVQNDKMIVSCPGSDCPFSSGLPVYVIDDDLYDHKPSFVVATIDKFARMAWEKNVGKLFSLDSEHLPPELVIQDELHLIAGPLGTVAGLYEVAVDEFCRRGNVGAKIIASTATIRNAENQILNLYGREFRQFPPQGFDIRDSYFAGEASPNERPSRRYIGILAPGSSGNTLLIRVYSVMLFATRYLAIKGYQKEVIDSFWTLTGYFNTLKQLGGAVINVIDDVHGRLKYLNGTKFKGLFPSDEGLLERPNFDELTGRKKNSEIGKILKELEVKYPDCNTYDLILASNMLSVGIDIGRLGLMVVQGQPKSNSEYIQATSRVGRQSPGLVLTMYDASRSRDRSHYEQFRAYHSSLYKYVEATSLTPFAERARDRALHAVLISLSRQLVNGLRNNDDAVNVGSNRIEVEQQIQCILDRLKIVDSQEYEAAKEQLYSILDLWEQMAASGDLVYHNYFKKMEIPLLTARFDENSGALPTLNSMRNVDVEAEVYLEV